MKSLSLFIALLLSFSTIVFAKVRLVEVGRRDGTRLLLRTALDNEPAGAHYAIAPRDAAQSPYEDVVAAAIAHLKPRGSKIKLPRQAKTTSACSRTSSATESSKTSTKASKTTDEASKTTDPTKTSATSTPPPKDKGNCPDGQVVDPADGRAKPNCIPDDDKKCPPGQRAASRGTGYTIDEATYKPDCGTDDNPDFKCDKPGEYDHMEVDFYKIKHSCRATKQKTDDKTAKYNTAVDKQKQIATDTKNKQDDETRKKKRRARAGACFAIMVAADMWSQDDTSSLTDDQLDGLVNAWDDAHPDPNFDLLDSMVGMNTPVYVTGITDASSGVSLTGIIGALSSAIGKSLSGIGKAATKFGKIFKDVKSGTRTATQAVIDAAKDSRVVKMIREDQTFQDCLTMAISEGVGAVTKRGSSTLQHQSPSGTRITIDYATNNGDVGASPEDQADQSMTLGAADDTDAPFQLIANTYPDGYARHDRLFYQKCQKSTSNGITRLEVEGGCCAFYRDDSCNVAMFAMTNREDGELRGDHNDAVRSWWCTFDLGCAGAPNYHG